MAAGMLPPEGDPEPNCRARLGGRSHVEWPEGLGQAVRPSRQTGHVATRKTTYTLSHTPSKLSGGSVSAGDCGSGWETEPCQLCHLCGRPVPKARTLHDMVIKELEVHSFPSPPTPPVPVLRQEGDIPGLSSASAPGSGSHRCPGSG